MLYGSELGASAAGEEDEEDEDPDTSGARIVQPGSRVSFM